MLELVGVGGMGGVSAKRASKSEAKWRRKKPKEAGKPDFSQARSQVSAAGN